MSNTFLKGKLPFFKYLLPLLLLQIFFAFFQITLQCSKSFRRVEVSLFAPFRTIWNVQGWEVCPTASVAKHVIVVPKSMSVLALKANTLEFFSVEYCDFGKSTLSDSWVEFMLQRNSSLELEEEVSLRVEEWYWQLRCVVSWRSKGTKVWRSGFAHEGKAAKEEEKQWLDGNLPWWWRHYDNPRVTVLPT